MCGNPFKPKVVAPPKPPAIPETTGITKDAKTTLQVAPKSATTDNNPKVAQQGETIKYSSVGRRRVGRGSLRIPLAGGFSSGINFPSS